MAEGNLNQLFAACLQGLRDMVDVNTIVGDPIETPEGTTIIPISKVSFGFGVGGGEVDGADAAKKDSGFGGGSGGGVSISPVGFLVVSNGDVKMLSIDASSPLDQLVTSIPTIVDTVKSFFAKRNDY